MSGILNKGLHEVRRWWFDILATSQFVLHVRKSQLERSRLTFEEYAQDARRTDRDGLDSLMDRNEGKRSYIVADKCAVVGIRPGDGSVWSHYATKKEGWNIVL